MVKMWNGWPYDHEKAESGRCAMKADVKNREEDHG